MLDRTQQHFRSEEALLKSTGFPGLADHGNHHKDLNSLMKEYFNLLRFLREWITRHIQTEDRVYGIWLNRHGVR